MSKPRTFHRVFIYEEPFGPDSKPIAAIKPHIAAMYVARGLAKYENFGIVISPKITVKSHNSLHCSQAGTYERVGTLPATPLILGGLTRNEHQPTKYSPFKAARVGH